MKSYSFILTINNPSIDEHMFLEIAKSVGAIRAAAQMELGE